MADGLLPDPAVAHGIGEPLSVFISYPTENRKIAEAIERALLDFDRRFDVFLDHSRIEDGSELTTSIEKALERADYFIGIGPEANRSNFSWCGFELGYFRATTKGRPRHVLAIYNNDIPNQFRAFLNVQVVSLEERHRSELGARIYKIEECQLYSFFQGLSEEMGRRFPPAKPAQYFDDAREWAEKSSREVTESYFNTLQEWVKFTWFPQKRIEVRTGNTAFWERELPKDSRTGHRDPGVHDLHCSRSGRAAGAIQRHHDMEGIRTGCSPEDRRAELYGYDHGSHHVIAAEQSGSAQRSLLSGA